MAFQVQHQEHNKIVTKNESNCRSKEKIFTSYMRIIIINQYLLAIKFYLSLDYGNFKGGVTKDVFEQCGEGVGGGGLKLGVNLTEVLTSVAIFFWRLMMFWCKNHFILAALQHCSLFTGIFKSLLYEWYVCIFLLIMGQWIVSK